MAQIKHSLWKLVAFEIAKSVTWAKGWSIKARRQGCVLSRTVLLNCRLPWFTSHDPFASLAMPSGFMTERGEINKYSNYRQQSKAKRNAADDLHISWCLRLPAAALTTNTIHLVAAGCWGARLSLTKVISCWNILSGICISRVTHCPLSPRSLRPDIIVFLSDM